MTKASVNVLTIDQEDISIMLRSIGRFTISNLMVSGIIRTPSGELKPLEIQWRFTTGSGINTLIVPLNKSALVSLRIWTPNTATQSNGIKVVATLIKGTTVNGIILAELVSGWVSDYQSIAYPKISTPVYSHYKGFTLKETPANPAAGANYVFSIPDYELRRLLSVQFTFTASVAAANRYPTIHCTDAAIGNAPVSVGQAITASQTPIVIFGLGRQSFATADVNANGINDNVIYRPSDRFRIVILNMQAADQISDIVLFWRVSYIQTQA